MAVDPYAPCPCGSGKKLKFCCADLAADIEKIDRLASSDQPHAALAHVEKLLAKEPDRASLLDIRAMLELSMEEFDSAEKTLQHFLAKHPDNASAHAQAALLAAAHGDSKTAVARLQDALERCGDAVPSRLFEAIGGVGHALLLQGQFVAARAHLLLYAGLAPPGDNRAIELLLRLNLQGGLPLLLRENLALAEAPTGVRNKAAFEEALHMTRRGQWRRAEAEFAKLLDPAAPPPAVLYNLAVVCGWQACEPELAQGLHHFAKLDVPLDDAIEAEALAQLVDPKLEDPQLESVRLTFPVNDEDIATERLAGDRRIEPYELDPEALDEEETTRPRSTHMLLDRPTPRSGAELTVEEAPNVVAFLSLYGKRTDRGARLEATTDRGPESDQAARLLAEILGDAIGAEESSEVVGAKSRSDAALSWRWRLPDDTPPNLRRTLLHQRRRRAILDDWTAAPRAALGGLSPQDAAAKPELRIPLLASVLIVEQAAIDPQERELFQELRAKLGLPRTETIDPETVDWDRLPIVRLARLDFARVPDDRLLQVFQRASMSGAGVATLAAAREIVSRESITDGVDQAYRQLIRSEPDPDRALEWADQAKARAAQAGKPGGPWAILQLEVQIERGDPVGVQSTLDEIRRQHLNEPGVADATYQLLYSAGLLVPRGAGGGSPMPPGAMPLGAMPPGADAPRPASEANRIWTPGQDAPAPAGGGKSALWTP
jgi:tetratricopeptide (TPR) repeat protein